jgi:hypothetical protein
VLHTIDVATSTTTLQPRNASVAIDIPEKRDVFRTVDGEVLTVLSGWLKKKSRTSGAWDRRYFKIVPEEMRLYYSHRGPVELDMDCSGGLYQSLAKAVAVAFHTIVDGEDPTESWVDLRLIPDVEPTMARGRKKRIPNRFDIDLGYVVLLFGLWSIAYVLFLFFERISTQVPGSQNKNRQ